MKERLILAAALLWIAAGSLYSQFRAPRASEGASWAQQRTESLAERLSLTEAQRQHALSIFTAADQASEPVEDKLAEARRALRDATKRNASDAEIDALAASIGTLTHELEAVQAKADTALYNLLTTAQREKLDRKAGGTRAPRQRQPLNARRQPERKGI